MRHGMRHTALAMLLVQKAAEGIPQPAESKAAVCCADRQGPAVVGAGHPCVGGHRRAGSTSGYVPLMRLEISGRMRCCVESVANGKAGSCFTRRSKSETLRLCPLPDMYCKSKVVTC